jgi:hypothetical protein
MTRAILFSVFVSIIFAGYEGATDAAGPDIAGSKVDGHEVHGSAHIDSHEHDGDGHEHEGDGHQDDHFCHCSVHAAALLSTVVSSATEERSASSTRYDDHFSSLVEPPLLRPPNS